LNQFKEFSNAPRGLMDNIQCSIKSQNFPI